MKLRCYSCRIYITQKLCQLFAYHSTPFLFPGGGGSSGGGFDTHNNNNNNTFTYTFHGDPRATFAEFFGTSNPFETFFNLGGKEHRCNLRKSNIPLKMLI